MAKSIAVSVQVQAKRFVGATGLLFDKLEFELAEGDVLALIGPSGVGKSTLLRMIAGLDCSYEGDILVHGQPAANAPTPGFVFQDPRLLPWLDAVANIRAVSPTTTDAEAIELLAGMGLAGYERTLPGNLSGGMQRRVALARALAVGPRLLILDEPFVSIDRKLVRGLQDVVAGIIERHRPTLILVSHEPQDAACLADRVIQLDGRPAQIISDDRIEISRSVRNRDVILRIADQLGGEAEANW